MIFKSDQVRKIDLVFWSDMDEVFVIATATTQSNTSRLVPTPKSSTTQVAGSDEGEKVTCAGEPLSFVLVPCSYGVSILSFATRMSHLGPAGLERQRKKPLPNRLHIKR